MYSSSRVTVDVRWGIECIECSIKNIVENVVVVVVVQ